MIFKKKSINLVSFSKDSLDFISQSLASKKAVRRKEFSRLFDDKTIQQAVIEAKEIVDKMFNKTEKGLFNEFQGFL